jgi:ABC transport system ATP-binding/permease protein
VPGTGRASSGQARSTEHTGRVGRRHGPGQWRDPAYSSTSAASSHSSSSDSFSASTSSSSAPSAAREAALHQQLAEHAADYEKLAALGAELDEVLAEKESLELEWLEAAEVLE